MSGLGIVAYGEEKIQLAVEAEGALPLLVALLRDGGDRTKYEAALTLGTLAEDNAQVAQAIEACGGREPLEALAQDPRDGEMVKLGRDYAQDVLKLLPQPCRSRESRPNPVQVVKALESGTSDEQCKAAEQLGKWAATSDEKRAAIRQAGGCEGLVALVVNGGEDAKWHAARALRNLANHPEAKESILKADGIAILTPIAKHGRGKVKEAASEALNLLSLADAKAKPAPVDTKPAAWYGGWGRPRLSIWSFCSTFLTLVLPKSFHLRRLPHFHLIHICSLRLSPSNKMPILAERKVL